MNTYDPADHIRYVHLSGPAHARSAQATGDTPCAPLPSGYANQSPRTRLHRRPAHVRDIRPGLAPLTA